MQPAPAQTGTEMDFSPHERALARSLGLPMHRA